MHVCRKISYKKIYKIIYKKQAPRSINLQKIYYISLETNTTALKHELTKMGHFGIMPHYGSFWLVMGHFG